MLNATESHSSFSASVQENSAERLKRLINSCHYLRQRLDQAFCVLSLIEDSIPEPENEGIVVHGAIQLLYDRMQDDYSGFWKEIKIAEGKGDAQ